MRKSLAFREGLRDAIREEIAERTALHQSAVAALKSARQAMAAAGAPARGGPLVMLAHGDSWFDYPLDGNGPSLRDRDIVAQLGQMGAPPPVILNLSHYGDATTAEMSLPKQQRMIEALQNPENWLGEGKPDAILFSGGGDDIAGNQFCIYLNYAPNGAGGLNAARLDGALAMIEASYRDLFTFRDRYAPGVPIFGHCYDFPTPDGSHPPCAGPWLKPSIDYCGWSVPDGKQIVYTALVAFREMLEGLASNPVNNFVLVETQNTLSAADWANELHPWPNGFKKLAQKSLAAIQGEFPGRI